MWVVNFGLERSAKYTYNWHKNVKKKRYMMNLFSIYLVPFNGFKWGPRNISYTNYVFMTIISRNIEMFLIALLNTNYRSASEITTWIKMNCKWLVQIHPWLRFLNVEEIEEV